jgi:hypothetical protein
LTGRLRRGSLTARRLVKLKGHPDLGFCRALRHPHGGVPRRGGFTEREGRSSRIALGAALPGITIHYTTTLQSGPPGNRPPISGVRCRCRPVGPAAHDVSGRQGSRTLISVGRTALAERPGQPYPATFRRQWRRWESNPPQSVCKTDSPPLAHAPPAQESGVRDQESANHL